MRPLADTLLAKLNVATAADSGLDEAIGIYFGWRRRKSWFGRNYWVDPNGLATRRLPKWTSDFHEALALLPADLNVDVSFHPDGRLTLHSHQDNQAPRRISDTATPAISICIEAIRLREAARTPQVPAAALA
ncbi:hypothetical protein [Rhodovastum atsumiense]|uniref:Uncharacterized protein n=1 Tax=Rhodovastum atsumiense TaxID=504468 RepID=A0A5M6J1I4_9PROT|nr:hypothetical protein [Rhodovastum atsumiense]KAA5613508.1 hypothetical protein F1189_05480 [Rhodovastum atsumiense]